MSQPEWKLITNLGDVNPIEYGGYFIYEDTTGVYGPEAELLFSPEDDDGEWIVYRFCLEKCTYENGVLSDNKFHPDHPAWFAKLERERASRPQDTTYLSNVAEYIGMEVDELIRLFCSDCSVDRAVAYRAVGDYHGFANLDGDPLTFTDRTEIELRYLAEAS